tara:strand:- start:33 stop:875 length:843 start_codon:yes stop_codon:yes gene_type:complete
MAEERLTLRDAMRSYSVKSRQNMRTSATGLGKQKISNAIGEGFESASKWWEKSIAPNQKAWKDIESGYDELGIAEDKRWGDGEAPKLFDKFQNPNKYEIPNVESGDMEFNVSGLKALGHVSTSGDTSSFEALAKSGKGDFKSLFSIQKNDALTEVSKEVTVDEGEDNTIKIEESLNALTDTVTGGATSTSGELDANNVNDISNAGGGDEIIPEDVSSVTKEVIVPELSWETDPEFKTWFDSENENVIFDSHNPRGEFLKNNKNKMNDMYKHYIEQVRGKE